MCDFHLVKYTYIINIIIISQFSRSFARDDIKG